MRKVLSLALASLFTFMAMASSGIGMSGSQSKSRGLQRAPESGVVVDHITPGNLQTQNPDGNFAATKYDDHGAVNMTMSYTGDSGAEYNFVELISNGEWWTVDWNWPDPSGYMANTTSGGYITRVKFNMSWVPESFQFAVSNEPITRENRYDAESVTLWRGSDGLLPEWTADGVYKYIYLLSAQEMITDLEIEWSAEAPAIPAKKPTIDCWENPVTPGSSVNVRTATNGATLHVDVYVNGEKHTGTDDAPTSIVTNSTYYDFKMPGSTNDVVKVTAYATKDGYVDSEVAEAEWTLAMPQASRPETQGGYMSSIRPGDDVVIVSSTPGAMIKYTYGIIDWDDETNNWESEEMTAPSPVSLTAPADAKKDQRFHITATAFAEGYRDSNSNEFYITINPNKLDAPTFSIPSGETVPAGTVVSIIKPAAATRVCYRLAGSYEQFSSEEASIDVTINETTTINAWAEDGNWENQSSTVEAKYIVLPPATFVTDHITVDNLKAQNPDGNFSATKYDDHKAKNATMSYKGESGAEYELTDVISNGTWWTVDWDYPAPQGIVANTTDGGFIHNIKFSFDWVPSEMDFYVSDQPITRENKNDATQITLIREGEEMPEWKADGIYKYFYLGKAQETMTDLAIEWGSEAPALTVKTPTIACYANPVIPGSSVTVSTLTSDAVLNVDVYVNGERHEGEEGATTSIVYEGSTYTFQLPGVPGDEVKVTAFATKAGLEDSESVDKTFKLEMPKAAKPSFDTYYANVIPGQTVSVNSATENATITYKYGLKDYDNEANNWDSEELSGAAPVTITVPATAKEGMVFYVEATAAAEGFAVSDKFESFTQVQSGKLEAPVFSIESGKEVIPGTKVKITRSEKATTLHYTINAGEEQTSTDLTVEVAINEATTIEAWVSGEAPYTDSDKVSASYTVEVLGPNQDALVPSMFTSEFKNSNYAEYSAKGAATGIEYVYNGGFWPWADVNCFYLDPKSSSKEPSILYNTECPKDMYIKSVKLETSYPWSGCYVMFSKDEPITSVSTRMGQFDYLPGRLRIINEDERADYPFDQWINLEEVGEEEFVNAKYFALWLFGQNGYLSRLLVEYDKVEGIDNIETGAYGADAIYDLNGVKMNADTNLAPGIYIRIVNGKAQKFIVK